MTVSLNTYSMVGTAGNTVVATVSGGSGNYDIKVDNGNIIADSYTGQSPYTYTYEVVDGTGTFVISVVDKADATKTGSAQFAVTSPPPKVQSFTIGDLSSLEVGQTVAEPTLTITPADATYKTKHLKSNTPTIFDWKDVNGVQMLELKAAGKGTLEITLTNEDGTDVVITKDYTIVDPHPDEYPRFVNDSHTAAPWNPIYVSDTEWKLDNVTSGGTIRYFAVWYSTKANLNDMDTTPPTVSQAKVMSWSSSDENIVSVDFTGSGANVAGSRNFHFKALTAGTATLTATTDRGEVIKLYVGVGEPADVTSGSTPAAPPLKFSKDLVENTTTVDDGDPLIFTPSVTGGKPPYTYEWFKDGAKLTGNGYDGSSLGIQTPQGYYADDEAGEYYVRVTDKDDNTIESKHQKIAIHHVIKEMIPSFNRTTGPNANLVLKKLSDNRYSLTGVTEGEVYAMSVVTAPLAGQELGALSVPIDMLANTDIAEPVVDGSGWKFTAKAVGPTKMVFSAANAPNILTVLVTVLAKP